MKQWYSSVEELRNDVRKTIGYAAADKIPDVELFNTMKGYGFKNKLICYALKTTFADGSNPRSKITDAEKYEFTKDMVRKMMEYGYDPESVSSTWFGKCNVGNRTSHDSWRVSMKLARKAPSKHSKRNRSHGNDKEIVFKDIDYKKI